MVNADRSLRLHQLVREAERLCHEEMRNGAGDAKLTRLAALLWIARDATAEMVEDQVGSSQRRAIVRERPHTTHTPKEGIHDGS